MNYITEAQAERHGIVPVYAIDKVDGRDIIVVDIATVVRLVERIEELDPVKPLDPKPWRYALLPSMNEAREAQQVTGGFVFDPRQGYEQDRKKYA